MQYFFIIFILLCVGCNSPKPSKDSNTYLQNPKRLAQALSTEDVLAVYKNIVHREISGTVSVEGIETMADNILPDYTFYKVDITDGSSYEYNNGRLPAVAAVSVSEPNKIRLLLPFDYIDTEADFLSAFIDREIKDRPYLANALVDIFARENVHHSFNTKRSDSIQKAIEFNGDTLTINATWREIYEPLGNDTEVKAVTISKDISLIFEADTLREIKHNY